MLKVYLLSNLDIPAVFSPRTSLTCSTAIYCACQRTTRWSTISITASPGLRSACSPLYVSIICLLYTVYRHVILSTDMPYYQFYFAFAAFFCCWRWKWEDRRLCSRKNVSCHDSGSKMPNKIFLLVKLCKVKVKEDTIETDLIATV